MPTSNVHFSEAGHTSQLWNQAAADASVSHNNLAGDGRVNLALADDVGLSGSAPGSTHETVALWDPVTSAPQLSEPAPTFVLDNRGPATEGTNSGTGYPCITGESEVNIFSHSYVPSWLSFLRAIILLIIKPLCVPWAVLPLSSDLGLPFRKVI